MMVFFQEEKKEKVRKHISKSEWERMKAAFNNRCVLCKKTEKQVVELQQAHLIAHSKGGSLVVPMCPICHKKYDKGMLTQTERNKLGITETQYRRLLPKKNVPKKKESDFLGTVFFPKKKKKKGSDFFGF